jgi:hypothetical protein
MRRQNIRNNVGVRNQCTRYKQQKLWNSSRRRNCSSRTRSEVHVWTSHWMLQDTLPKGTLVALSDQHRRTGPPTQRIPTMVGKMLARSLQGKKTHFLKRLLPQPVQDYKKQ